MKKKKRLVVFVLTLSLLLLSAACASSSGTGQPDPGHDDTPGKLNMNWAGTRPLPSQPAKVAATDSSPDDAADPDERFPTEAAPLVRPAASQEER